MRAPARLCVGEWLAMEVLSSVPPRGPSWHISGSSTYFTVSFPSFGAIEPPFSTLSVKTPRSGLLPWPLLFESPENERSRG